MVLETHVLRKRALAQDEELVKLRKVIRDFVSKKCDGKDRAATAAALAATKNDATKRNENEESSADEGDVDLVSKTATALCEPEWHKGDNVYRCIDPACRVEVVGDFCTNLDCKKQYLAMNDDDSCPTDNQAVNNDRSVVPRGTTPLLDIEERPVPVEHSDRPTEYRHRSDEYQALLKRGATRLMCETFLLEFSEKSGIYAWADSALYETFAGPAMQQHDFWKIYLGRRIVLDKDDLDGSEFIEGLLEDALMFPLRSMYSDVNWATRWHTVEETPGVWVTKPMKAGRELEDHEDSEVECHYDCEGVDEGMCDVEDDSYDHPNHTPNAGLPVIEVDSYETCDDGFELNVEMEVEYGGATRANVPDMEWTEEDDNKAEEKVELDTAKRENQGELREGDAQSRVTAATIPRDCIDPAAANSFVQDGMSDCDSDFDEDEELSGDDTGVLLEDWKSWTGREYLCPDRLRPVKAGLWDA